MELKMLSLFSGIGAFEKALENIGIKINLVNFCEIDKYASQAYCAIHNVDKKLNLNDITKVDIEKLPTEGVDIVTHGSPCFVKGSKVLTKNGYRNIEDIKIGDYVLTHTGNYKMVTNIGMNENKEILKIKPQGILPIYATSNHPFYVITKEKKWDNNLKKYVINFSFPYWKELKDITKNDYVGINIIKKEENPFNLTQESCWLLGRYIADGHIRHEKRKERENSFYYGIIFSIGNNKIEDFKEHLKTYHMSIYPHTKSTYRAVWNSKEFVEFIEEHNFGKSALEKDIPNFILNLPKDLAQSFLEGYLSGDGCQIGNKFKANSISQTLIMKLQLLIAKVYSTGGNISFYKRPETTIIEGRTVNQHNTYDIAFFKKNTEYVKYIVTENYVWFPVKELIDLEEKEDVYNLSVEEDNSYTVNNVIVHNCQDFSTAGLQAGGDIGIGTRSSLMWNSVAIIKHVKPKFVVWENVKNVLSKKHKHNFEKYLKSLEDIGYNNYYQVLNAKDYGIPQNRERIFVISIRKDIDKGNFKFPEKQTLQLKLKDLLDDEVDEKFYLKDSQIERIKNSTFMQEKKRIQNKEYCDTLLARNWKDPKCIRVCKNNQSENVEDIAPTQTSNCGGSGSSATISKREDNNKIKVIGNYMPSGHDASRVVDSNGIAPTVKENHGTVTATNVDFKIRKLTPKECWRLMGFSDEDFQKASDTGLSNTQLYKQAGNSIVVDVLEKIFKNLFLE